MLKLSKAVVSVPAIGKRIVLLFGFAGLFTVVVGQFTQAQTFTLVHTFTGDADGALPQAGLTIDSRGNLYGTATGGGSGQPGAGYGVAFKISQKNGGWMFNPLHAFSAPGSRGSDGENPQATMVFGPDGALYGSTITGGIGCDAPGCGTVFRLRPPASACKTSICYGTESLLYLFGQFPGDGASPSGRLLFNQAGNIYGTTTANDINQTYFYGTVYQLTRSGADWAETVLYEFTGGSDGSGPSGGLIADGQGNLYGMTLNSGGGSCQGGCGTVYELSPNGSGWTEQTIYTFQGGPDGGNPEGDLISDRAGAFYGVTDSGGVNGGGTVFKLTPSGGSWSLSTLYSFAATSNGTKGSLVMDTAGNLYGTTRDGGAFGFGAVYELTSSGGSWTYSSLHDFTNGNDGAQPYGNVALDVQGNVYGTASRAGALLEGTVYQIRP